MIVFDYPITHLMADAPNLLPAISLQLGEHAHCGPGVLPNTGFSYDPESFMAAGIHVFNGSWQDMGVPTMEHALGLVQVASQHLRPKSSSVLRCHGKAVSNL